MGLMQKIRHTDEIHSLYGADNIGPAHLGREYMDKILCKELSEDFETVELFPLADLHIGDILTRIDEFDTFSKMILKEPNRYIIINGDIFNNNLKNSLGSVYEDIIPPSQQRKEGKKRLLPLKDRILCVNSGNHEGRTKKEADVDISEDLADYLGVPYNEDETLMKLTFGKKYNQKRQSYSIYATHGRCGGRRPGNKVNNMEMYSMNILADVYIFAHGHTKLGYKPVFRVPDLYNNVIREIEQLFVMSGAWQSYGGYGKRGGYRPQSRGSFPIILHGKNKLAEARI